MDHQFADFTAWNQMEKKFSKKITAEQSRWKKRHSRKEPKDIAQEKWPSWNTYMGQSCWLSRQVSLIPGLVISELLASKDFSWQSYIWEKVVLTYRTNAHRLFLVKVEQITAAFQNPITITGVFFRKTPEAFYFVNVEVSKAAESHETREGLFLSASREMLQLFFSHNMSKCLTCYSFSVKRYGDRNNLCPGRECEKAAFAAVLQLGLKKNHLRRLPNLMSDMNLKIMWKRTTNKYPYKYKGYFSNAK